jgi:hypothetical protein
MLVEQCPNRRAIVTLPIEGAGDIRGTSFLGANAGRRQRHADQSVRRRRAKSQLHRLTA